MTPGQYRAVDTVPTAPFPKANFLVFGYCFHALSRLDAGHSNSREAFIRPQATGSTALAGGHLGAGTPDVPQRSIRALIAPQAAARIAEAVSAGFVVDSDTLPGSSSLGIRTATVNVVSSTGGPNVQGMHRHAAGAT